MTVPTQTLRNWWAPPCKGPWANVALYGAGAVSVRPALVAAVRAMSSCLAAHHYATRAADTGAFNCRQITGGTSYSLHAYGIAVDLNWSTNPYGARLVTDMPPSMVEAIKSVRTNNGKQVWEWGGNFSGNKDGMHFQAACAPGDIGTGINPWTVPGMVKKPAPIPAVPVIPVKGVHTDPRDVERVEVFWLQDMLNVTRGSQGKKLIVRDGKFGAQTGRAVEVFKIFVNAMADIAKSKSPRWPVNGMVGPQCVAGLCWWVSVMFK